LLQWEEGVASHEGVEQDWQPRGHETGQDHKLYNVVACPSSLATMASSCTGDEISECETSDIITLHPKNDSDDGEDEDEDDSVGDESDTDLRDSRGILGCLHSRPCSVCLYLSVILFMIASFIALVVIGVLIVAPFRRVSTFNDVTCETVALQTQNEPQRCSCGKGCNSKYPCIQISIRLPQYKWSVNDSMEGEVTRVMLFDNESTLQRECTYYPPCKSSRMANERAVREYEERYGRPGQTFPCLYNPDNPSEVIRTRRFHMNHVVHGMLWSSLIFVISLSILVIAIRKKGCSFL